MSKNILLDTRTSNFLALLGNGKSYSNSPFQRDYSWTSENPDDLWNDIVSIRIRAGDRYFMGAIMVVA